MHLKRFDFVNNKWVKTQKVVNFPFKNFDPTAYLASIPHETIIRHRKLQETLRRQQESGKCNDTNSDLIDRIAEEKLNGDVGNNGYCGANDGYIDGDTAEKLIDVDEENCKSAVNHQRSPFKKRQRLESTSLMKTPVMDEDLQDFHEHKLLKGQDKFDLKYQLYAVVVSKICYVVFELIYEMEDSEIQS